jgi:hypothetical protein
MCVSLKHGLVLRPNMGTQKLDMYSLVDGTLVRSVSTNTSAFVNYYVIYSGLCVSADGDSVLLCADSLSYIKELRVADGYRVRTIGQGLLQKAQSVDCNADVIVVAEYDHHICVLSWVDGSMRSRFGSFGHGPGSLKFPAHVQLVGDGNQIVVADEYNHRLCVFHVNGNFEAALGRFYKLGMKQSMHFPRSVVSCALDNSFVVANYCNHNLLKISRRTGAVIGVYNAHIANKGGGDIRNPGLLAALPDGGCIMLDSGYKRVQQITNQRVRILWMQACASGV